MGTEHYAALAAPSIREPAIRWSLPEPRFWPGVGGAGRRRAVDVHAQVAVAWSRMQSRIRQWERVDDA